MPYRSQEYVPGVYQPNDSRLSELIYLQNQNEANRLEQQGRANALMWTGIGRAGAGMLSDLAEYKRQAPARAEAERVRREADKLRGLEQMAGAGKLDQKAYGELLQQEGFVGKGQEILDKDMTRKATAATYADAEQKRKDREHSEITQAIYRVQDSKDPVSEWRRVMPSLQGKLGDKFTLSPEYNPDEVGKVLADLETTKDITDRNLAAKAAAERLQIQKLPEDQAYKEALTMASKILPVSTTPERWAASWQNILNALPEDPAVRQRILAKLPYSQQFSDEALQFAKDTDGGGSKGAQNVFSVASDQFREAYGHEPKTQAEIAHYNQMVRNLTGASHVPTAGRGSSARNLTPVQRATIERWKANEYSKLEKRRVDEGLTDAEMDDAKEQIQMGYLTQLGVDEGPTLGEIAATRGQDISGRPLAAQAQPGAALPQGAAPQGGAPATGGMVLMQSPDGREVREVPAADAQYYISRGGRVVQQGRPTAPAAPATPAAPAPQQQSEMVGPAAPPLPTEQVMMRSPSGRVERVPPSKIEEYLQQRWVILPPSVDPVAAAAKDVGSRIYRDLTTGAPSRSAAPPRR